MIPIIRPLLRPIPIPVISAKSLLIATAFFSTSKMSTTSAPQNWVIKPYTPRHTSWPYSPSDFTRQDSSLDASFYSNPRFVTHIDDAAIDSLMSYYDAVLPRKGRILDFCSSWISYYPKSVEDAASAGDLGIAGFGMNEAELDANPALNKGRVLIDLNVDSDIRGALVEADVIGSNDGEKLDVATNVVSIDYLTNPVGVLQSLLEATNIGGVVHLTVSNRCFPTKAISRWLRVDEDERLLMVGDFLHFAGWTEIEIVELSDGTLRETENQSSSHGSLQGIRSLMGRNRRDPLWVVRAKKGP